MCVGGLACSRKFSSSNAVIGLVRVLSFSDQMTRVCVCVWACMLIPAIKQDGILFWLRTICLHSGGRVLDWDKWLGGVWCEGLMWVQVGLMAVALGGTYWRGFKWGQVGVTSGGIDGVSCDGRV